MFAIGLSSCDEASGPANPIAERPYISDFQVTPSTLEFTVDDGIGDTLVTFAFDVRSNIDDGYRIVAEIAGIRDREVRKSDTLRAVSDGSGRFTGSLELLMNTTRFENLVVYAFPLSPNGTISDRVESTITVRGADSGKPEVLEIIHPDTVIIPMPGEPDNQFTIAARVTHSLSLEYINTVRLELFDSTGNRIFASSMLAAGIEEDSVPPFRFYEQNFSINSGNSPENYRVEVHAVDIAGTISDTLSTTLIIAR
jgi:hypothetical protein